MAQRCMFAKALWHELKHVWNFPPEHEIEYTGRDMKKNMLFGGVFGTIEMMRSSQKVNQKFPTLLIFCKTTL